MKTYKIVTLGCRTNQAESQAYADQLQKLGYVACNERPTLCVVNTCTVTQSADQRSKYQIRALRRQYPEARIAVTGCLTEQKGVDFPEADFVIPNLDKENLLSYLFPGEELPEFKIERFEAHTRAFVKVQDGCNSYCSYCIIPFVRGRSRSREMSAILDEITGLVANGYKEVVLTGINIGDFEPSLATLVREVDKIEGLERIRISSIDADEVDDDLLDAVINSKKTCPSMHIVLQSGSNFILKRMRRKYTRQEFIDTCTRLTNAHPDFTFTTDVIVGFPGETEKDFAETLNMIDTIKFAKVHMFPYSVRPGTRAARFTDLIDPKIIERRRKSVMQQSEKVGFCLREKFVGQEMSVLVENGQKGHTENFLPVEIEGTPVRSNEIKRVRLIKNTPSSLIGEICV